MTRYILALAVLLLAGPVWADSAWVDVDQRDGTTGSTRKNAKTGDVYQTTMDSATSLVFDTRLCDFPGVTVDAVNLTGATVDPQKCNDADCSTPVSIGASPLSDGDTWVLDYWMPFIRIASGTSGDIIQITCAKG